MDQFRLQFYLLLLFYKFLEVVRLTKIKKEYYYFKIVNLIQNI